jgi:RNA polymerase sigma-70 factor (ECF subfamily)
MSQILTLEAFEEPAKLENQSLNFADIFREFEHPVHSYLLHLTQDPVKAEDLAQETFIRIFDKLKTFRGEASLHTWIYRIATNVSIDCFRGKAARQDKVNQSFEAFEEEWQDQDAPTPEHEIEQSEMSRCVQQFILRLPLPYRTVIVLHDLQGLKIQDIADVLECSVDTVKIRLHRARKKIREFLHAGCELDHDERNVLVCEPKAGNRTTL